MAGATTIGGAGWFVGTAGDGVGTGLVATEPAKPDRAQTPPEERRRRELAALKTRVVTRETFVGQVRPAESGTGMPMRNMGQGERESSVTARKKKEVIVSGVADAAAPMPPCERIRAHARSARVPAAACQ